MKWVYEVLVEHSLHGRWTTYAVATTTSEACEIVLTSREGLRIRSVVELGAVITRKES